MRALWLCEYPELHGAERSLLANAETLAAAGVELIACAPPAGPLAEELARRAISVLALPAAEGAAEPRRAALERVIRHCRPDLLHANSIAMGRLSGPVAAELGLPSLAHLRDVIGLSRAAVADLNRHTRLLAVSRAVKKFHVAQSLHASKVFVAYNGVDLERFAPSAPSGELRASLGIAPQAPLLGAIGQIGLRKGFDTLLSALPAIVEAWPETHLVIAGARTSQKDESRAFAEQLRRQAQSPPLAGRVHWLGVVRDVAELLVELTILVHPARQEPLGRVLLEAAAAARAIVATEVGGTREIFPAKSEAAVLVPPDDPARLASAVSELLASPPRREALGAAARRRAEQRFDHRVAARRLLRHYREVASRGFRMPAERPPLQ